MLWEWDGVGVDVFYCSGIDALGMGWGAKMPRSYVVPITRATCDSVNVSKPMRLSTKLANLRSQNLRVKSQLEGILKQPKISRRKCQVIPPSLHAGKPWERGRGTKAHAV